MPKVFPHAAKVKWSEEKLGARGSATISHHTRAIARTWLQGKLRASYRDVMDVSIQSLQSAYNDTTDKALNDLAKQIENARPSTDSSAQPENPEAQDNAQKNAKIDEAMKELEAIEAMEGTGKSESQESAEQSRESKVDELERLLKELNGLVPADPAKGEPQEEPQPQEQKDDSDLARAIAAAVKGHIKSPLDEKRVRQIAQEEAQQASKQGPAPVHVTITKTDGSQQTQDMGIQHRKFPLLLKVLEARLNAALVGPAGTGKTTAAHNIAKSLACPYECQSFSGTTTKSDLLGFTDANGNYRDTPFRRAYEHGGIWVGDEFDAGNANANVVINAATANGVCSFPDGMKDKSETFRAVLCMNTYGNGASRQYVGRNQLDAATMDRFVFVDWELDEALEASFLGVKKNQKPVKIDAGGILAPDAWLERVVKIRAAIETLQIRHLVTPRASIHGARLFEVGIGKKHVEEMVLWKGLDKEQRDRVEAHAS